MSNFRSPLREINPSLFRRDSRTNREKFNDFMETPEGFAMIMGCMLALFVLMPSLGELWLLLSFFFITQASKAIKRIRLPFRIPKTEGILDLSQLHPATRKPSVSEGISFFGNEIGTRKELWFNNSDMRTHILIFGSTGAGKTETLLSLSYNALVQGSGMIYVDGKGENSLYRKVFTLARSMGREDDVLVINYMTGARDVFGPQEYKLSNTLNPFTSGSSGGLTEMLVSLMDDAGSGADMWKGRAMALMSAIMMALTYLRDNGEILLDVDKIREYLILDNIIDLYRTRRDMPAHIREAVRGYLVSLPGFSEQSSTQSESVLEQHGFLQMQFTRVLGSLADSYGFIYKTNLGEVDFKDVVLNRRILVVLLPALEKSTEELASLGKVIVACVKQMMAAALGNQIEGQYSVIEETKPTNSQMPFMTIFDEYGYYATPGSAVMPAQGRSLGFSMIFAGQDLPAFEKASKEEAATIIANCNIKICMKLEDPQSTYELFERSAGETLAPAVNSLEYKSGLISSSFVPTQNVSLDFKKRINVQDLKEQTEGEAHILFKSALVRARMFYANPPRLELVRVNYFLKIEPPTESEIKSFLGGVDDLTKIMTNKDRIKELEEFLVVEKGNIDDIVSLKEKYKDIKDKNEMFAAIITDVAVGLHDKFKRDLESFEVNEEAEEKINIFSRNKDEEYIKDIYSDRDDDDDDDDGSDIFLSEDRIRDDFEIIEKINGKTVDDAKEIANNAINELKGISNYPSEGMPSIKEPEEIMDLLRELDSTFSDDSDD